jgi:hypothetical protein
MKNTKKLWSNSIFAIVVIALVGFAALSCGNGDCTTHTWGSWSITTPATCTSTGTGTRTCTSCDATDSNTTIPALGHDINNWTANPGYKSCNNTGCSERTVVNLGDTGPGGGIIFYITPTGFTFFQTAADTTGVTRHYLEAAPANISVGNWASRIGDLIPGLSENATDETDWVIGRGMRNTEIIIAHGSANGYTTRAATEARNTTSGTLTDWFLPSRNELAELYKIAGQHGIPNTGRLWSSSQSSNNSPWHLDLSNGSFSNGSNKSVNWGARAVRAF